MLIAPRRWLWPLFSVALAGGCGPALPELVVENVSPSWGFNGEETTLSITGDGLYPAVSVAAGGERPRVDAQFSVRLEGSGLTVPLEGVELRAYGELATRVPTGVTPGRYDLRVTRPGGDSDLLPKAFLVTDSRADHLGLAGDLRAYTVNETVEMEVQLLDNVDEIVADDLEIVVSFDTSLDGEGLVLDGAGLLNAVIDDDAHTITGRLSGEGLGGFAFTSTLPDNVNITVSPAETDSIVRDATSFVPFTTGNEEIVAITLPEDFTATAGEPFEISLALVDEFGIVLTDRAVSVFLREVCGGSDGMPRNAVSLAGGVATVTVALHRATSESPTSTCTANGVEAYGEQQGTSALVLVRPAAVESLSVLLGSAGEAVVVTAGEPELSIVVRAEDPFGNAVTDYAADIHFTDSVNGLDSRVEGLGSAGCFPWIDGLLPCLVSLDVAAEGVVLNAQTDTGVSGQSEPFEVRAGPADSLNLTLPGATIIAGSYFEVELAVVDRLGNAVDVELSGEGAAEISDSAGGTSCSYAAALGVGRHAFGCLSTVAHPSLTYTASLSGLGLQGSAGPATVINGSLARVEISLPSSVVAGDTFTLNGSAVDAWGNPYTSGDRSITLVDSTGTLVPSAATIDSAGAISTQVSITGAGLGVEVMAVRGPNIYGVASFDVTAGSLDHYGVEPANIWVWRGESLSVALSARDAYDNLIGGFTGSVSISSSQALFLAQTVSDFEDGLALVDLRWDAAGLADRVLATDGATTGSSVAIDALDPDCADPPIAALLLDGSEEVTSCLSAGSATVTADFSQSALGGAGLSHFLFDDALGDVSRTGNTSTSLTYSVAGLYVPTLLVVDTSACAGLAQAVLWVNDKGAPAGELSVSLSHSTRTAGGSASDADMTVSVSAYDCAGDRAAAATLCARTDMGELSAGLVSSGAGLCLALDTSGQGSFTWSAQNLAFDGEAALLLGVHSGAAYGQGTVLVVGDNHRPEVAWWTPGGRLLESVDALRIGFTEPLDNLNYDSRVTLTGPNGVVSTSTSLEAGGQELVITPQSAVDGALGAWTLSLSSLMRDDSGNRLSGDWSGSVSGFSLRFGDVNDQAPQLSACAPSEALIIPDGDNGSGEEADSFSLSLAASAAPTWWRLEAYDAAGTLVRTLHEPANTSSDTLIWDARGDDGRIVPEGPWELAIYAIDSQSNVSDPCFASVEVLQRYGAP